MPSEINQIILILESILGKPSKKINDDLQLQFNCPVCSENKGLAGGDGKYNLEVSLKKMKFNCWVCGQTDNTCGNISKLIKKFGNDILLDEYYKCIKSLKESKLYELNIEDKNDVIEDTDLFLPNNFIKIESINNIPFKVKNYLIKRGINDRIINKYNIGYTPFIKGDSISQRIIIPSYNSYGELNYWVGRDYSGNPNVKQKYKNPNIEKQNIIFNENKINWYGDITLVEGPFDHICVPNSIPLLGKCIKKNGILYNSLMNNAKSKVMIFLDDDAIKNSILLYNMLNNYTLLDKVYIIPCPTGYDAALYYQCFGYKGICNLLKNKVKPSPLALYKYLL